MRLFHLILSFASAALLSACATNIPSDYRLAPATTSGLLVGSITYTGALGARQVWIRNNATQDTHRLEVGQAQTINPFAKPEFDTDLAAVGGPFAVELPSGSYTITMWRIVQGSSILSSTTPIEIVFDVQAGKATYLGSFHFVQTSRFGLGSGSAIVSLEEKSGRDLPVLRKRFPVLDTVPFGTTLEAGTKISALGGSSDRRTNISVPLFVPIRK